MTKSKKLEPLVLQRGWDTHPTNNEYYQLATANGLLRVMERVNELISHITALEERFA